MLLPPIYTTDILLYLTMREYVVGDSSEGKKSMMHQPSPSDDDDDARLHGTIGVKNKTLILSLVD